MDLDEVPISGIQNGILEPKYKSKTIIEEFAHQGAPGATEIIDDDFSQLSLYDQLNHGNWKARKGGLDIIAVAPNEPESASNFLSSLGNLVKESNASVLESLLDACVALLSRKAVQISRMLSFLLKIITEKGLVGRPKAVQSSLALLRLLMESRDTTIIAACGDSLSGAFSHKTPKNRQAAVTAFSLLVEEFGVISFSPHFLMKAISPLCNDGNAQVRKEALKFVVSCYRYLGSSVMSFLTDLRDVQQQELEKMFGDVTMHKKTAHDSLASDSIKCGLPRKGICSTTGVYKEIADPDVYFPVLSKLPPDFYKLVLDKNAKWQERNIVLTETLLPLLMVPSFKINDDYTELVKCLREVLTDPQLPLNTTAFTAIQCLAKGLRSTLATNNYMRFLIPTIFNKFKDKKKSVLENVYTSIHLFLINECCTFEQLQDEIDSAFISKIPHHRLAMISWLNQVVSDLPKTNLNRTSRLCRCQHFKKLLGDDKIEVREATLSLIGKLVKIVGEQPFSSLIRGLDSKQMLKVTNTIEDCSLVTSDTQEADTQQTSMTDKRHSLLPRALALPAFSNGGGKEHAAGIAVNGTLKSNHADTDDAVSYESSMPPKNEAYDKLRAALGETCIVVDDFGSKEWKKRQEAILTVESYVKNNLSETQCEALIEHLLVVFDHTPGYKESICQVNNAMAGCLCVLLKKATGSSSRAAYTIVKGFSPKLSDVKCKGPVRELLCLTAEAMGPKMVIKHVLSLAGTISKPKQLVEALDWVQLALAEFPDQPVDAKYIVDFTKINCFDAQPPLIKTAGICLMVALRARVGTRLDSYFSDINPHILSTIQQEIEKGYVTPSDATGPRTMKASYQDNSVLCSSRNSSSIHLPNQTRGGAEGNPRKELRSSSRHHISTHVDPSKLDASDKRRSSALPLTAASRVLSPVPQSRLHAIGGVSPGPALHSVSTFTGFGKDNHRPGQDDDDLPSTDVSQSLPPLTKVISSGTDWKIRLAAVKKTDDLMIANHKNVCGSAAINECLKALKGRFEEVNKNFVVDVLRTMSLVIESSGPEATRSGIKYALPHVLPFLGDQKAALREEAARFCSIAISCLSLEQILPMVVKPLGADSMFARCAILDIVGSAFDQYICDLEQSHNPPNLVPVRLVQPLLLPILRLCMDRHADVRNKGEFVLGYMINLLGQDAAFRAVADLRPAEQQQVKPVVDRAVEALMASETSAEQAEDEESEQVVTLPHQTPAQQQKEPPIPENSVASLQRFEQLVAACDTNDQHHQYINQVQHQPVPIKHCVVTPEPASIRDIIIGIRAAPDIDALRMCQEFKKCFEENPKCCDNIIIDGIVGRLRHTLKAGNPVDNPAMHANDNISPISCKLTPGELDLSTALVECLTLIFSQVFECVRKIAEDTLRGIFSLIVDCLMIDPPHSIVRAMNAFALSVVQRAPTNTSFNALLVCLADYTTSYLASTSPASHRYMTLVVKCLMRLDTSKLSLEAFVNGANDFIISYPASQFRGKDDIPIRTIRAITLAIAKQYGHDLLVAAEKKAAQINEEYFGGKPSDDSVLFVNLVSSVLDHVIKQQEQSGESAPNQSQLSQQPQPSVPTSHRVNTPSSQPDSPKRKRSFTPSTVRCVVSHPPSQDQVSTSQGTNCTPTPNYELSPIEITSLFGRLEDGFLQSRKPNLTHQGILEIYMALKDGYASGAMHLVTEKFDKLFDGCSAAFRAYLARKLSGVLESDENCIEGFQFPKKVHETQS